MCKYNSIQLNIPDIIDVKKKSKNEFEFTKKRIDVFETNSNVSETQIDDMDKS